MFKAVDILGVTTAVMKYTEGEETHTFSGSKETHPLALELQRGDSTKIFVLASFEGLF